MNILIIHYNTPLLTEYLVKSINKYTPNCVIYIFDNSDKEPFIYRQDNLVYFDNTKGQIINFEEWLKKYPNRIYSPGKSNNYGSAKHCYSVDKCMDLIGDDFILLDSDVLLKRDISDIYNNDYMFCGEIVQQPMSNICRVVPFICYINVNACKLFKIHYFDENHIHGLYCNAKIKNADHYDTGAGFLLQTYEFPCKKIKYEDYIIHFKGGSWNDVYSDRIKRTITPQEWAEENKEYWI